MAAPSRGRPRSFDRDAALDKAIRLFWRKGYEATSTRDLTEELGIGAPSLYAAFGDKQSLFTEAVQCFGTRYGGFMARVFGEAATARAAAERLLRLAAVEYTKEGQPPGCMVISAGVNTTNTEVADMLRQLRNNNVGILQEWIRRDIEAGILPAETDAAGLARYTAAVLQGMSQGARDGASAAELGKAAELAISAWPEEVTA
ncbi:TetR/AcrR family transcriptional regulator [Nocardia sp. NPDC050406]|uniref:TetR/AcrR family transcriptional regulator n=1 Tax=Nocardia sp. NPDC050406 TaxID=3364318 RepID=UPI0037B5EF6F